MIYLSKLSFIIDRDFYFMWFYMAVYRSNVLYHFTIRPFNRYLKVLQINVFNRVNVTIPFTISLSGKHIVAALSVHPSVHPVPCPANNFKTTVGI